MLAAYAVSRAAVQCAWKKAALSHITGDGKRQKSSHSKRVSHADCQVARWMRVALESQDGRISYASTTFYIGSSEWQSVNATLSPLETDHDARLGIAFQGPGALAKSRTPTMS